ncbi:MAG: Swt1 family HEPN domain-containing protein [Candidatus Nanopelagicales bacterium]
MATTNKQRIGDVLDLVVAGLGPWLDQRMTAKYGQDWQTVVAQTINDGRDMIQSMDDPAFVFRVFDKMWIPMLKDQLTYEDRRCVSSLWDTRKQWAHGGKFTDEQAERALSDAEHVLRAVGSVVEADQVDLMRRDLRRVRFEKDQAHYQAQTEKTLAVQVDTAGLPPWREVVEPHDDVARGEFELAQFAADLRLVAQGRSGPEYSDPTQFFQRTYLTRGLRYLLTQTAKRLNGVGRRTSHRPHDHVRWR